MRDKKLNEMEKHFVGRGPVLVNGNCRETWGAREVGRQTGDRKRVSGL